MKKKLLLYVVIIFSLIGCKGADGPAGPAGPKLKGTLAGFVYLVNINGSYQTDMSGVTISLAGTSVSGTSDVNGKFEITNVETGTYEVIYTKTAYGIFKKQGVSFASGGLASLGGVSLGIIPVSSPIPVLTATTSAGVSVTVNGTLTSAATSAQYYRVYMAKTSTINPLDPTTYLASSWYIRSLR